MVTNGEFFKKLTNEEKLKFREQYGNHPLKDFIDWQQFYDSESGDEMEFVSGTKCKMSIINDGTDTTIITDSEIKNIDDNEDDEEMNCIILSEFIDDESKSEYLLVFCIDDNTFYKIPKPIEEVNLIPEEFGGEKPDEDEDDFMLDDYIEDELNEFELDPDNTDGDDE